MRFVYCNKDIKWGDSSKETLKEYGIMNNSMILMVPKLKGGGDVKLEYIN